MVGDAPVPGMEGVCGTEADAPGETGAASDADLGVDDAGPAVAKAPALRTDAADKKADTKTVNIRAPSPPKVTDRRILFRP
jgi:hypothetical protein